MAVFGAHGGEGVGPVALHGDCLYTVAAARGQFLGREVHHVAVAGEGGVDVGVADAACCSKAPFFVEDVDLHVTHVVLEHVCTHRIVVVYETDE